MVVRQVQAGVPAPTINRSSTITIEVPARTDVDVANLGGGADPGRRRRPPRPGLRLDGADRRDPAGLVDADAPIGEVEMTDVTVAGSAAVTKRIGGSSRRRAGRAAALDRGPGAGPTGEVTVHTTLGTVTFGSR